MQTIHDEFGDSQIPALPAAQRDGRRGLPRPINAPGCPPLLTLPRGPLSPQLTEINATSLDCCAKRCNVTRPHHWYGAPVEESRNGETQVRILSTYMQVFYYQCPPQEGAPAKAAGFGWDPIRRRYYTEDPSIAVNFEACADSYAKLLLADVLSAAPSHKHQERSRDASAWSPDQRRPPSRHPPSIMAWMPHRAIDQPQMQRVRDRIMSKPITTTLSSDGQNRRPQPCPIARDGDVRRGSCPRFQ